MITKIDLSNQEDVRFDLTELGMPNSFMYKDVIENSTIFEVDGIDFDLAECSKAVTSQGLILRNADDETCLITHEVFEALKEFI